MLKIDFSIKFKVLHKTISKLTAVFREIGSDISWDNS